MTPSSETSTHVFKTASNLELALDVTRPSNPVTDAKNVALIHFHGGFLVIGDKQTFPPKWLINAIIKRGWTYITPAYRLLPEATGKDVVSDAVDATKWVQENLSSNIIIAGSSAGGYLSLVTVTQFTASPPLAVLALYGMLDLTDPRYINPGITLVGEPSVDAGPALAKINDAAKSGAPVLDNYPFPKTHAHPPEDPRMRYIAALHQEALYSDLVTGKEGLSKQILSQGISAIPEESKVFFPTAFGLSKSFPPTALVHGAADAAVFPDQSTNVAEKLKELGVKVSLEVVEGQNHGFDAMLGDVDIEADSQDVRPASLASVESLKRTLTFLDEAVKSRVWSEGLFLFQDRKRLANWS